VTGFKAHLDAVGGEEFQGVLDERHVDQRYQHLRALQGDGTEPLQHGGGKGEEGGW